MPQDQATINEGVQKALESFLRTDRLLLELDVNERSITHKLAEHLQVQFPEWHVDCEYNRDGCDPKTLSLRVEQTSSDDPQARTVYPDVIVHHRNTSENLIALEVKKSSSADDGTFDKEKLTAFRTQLGYRYGVFVRFETGVLRCGVEDFTFI